VSLVEDRFPESWAMENPASITSDQMATRVRSEEKMAGGRIEKKEDGGANSIEGPRRR